MARRPRASAIYPLVLFLTGLSLSWRLFRLEYSQYMGSIEGAYVGISRHILAHWGDLSWWPAWYGGIPFQNSYPPLLHHLVALTAVLLPVSVVHAHHIIGALFFSLGPVTVYWMAARLSGRRALSFCAALVYALVSPSGLMIRIVGGDMGHPLRPRRLNTLVVYGDGPHIASLALLPLALLALDWALEKRTPFSYFLAAIAMVAVVLTNWLGAFALAALALCYLAGRAESRGWLTAGALGLFAYFIASPWVPPSTIRTIQFNAKTIGGDYQLAYLTLLKSAPFAIAGFLLLKFLSRRLPAWQQCWILFAAVMAWITLGGFWFGVAVVPQPERYHLEMDLGIVLAVVMGLGLLLESMPRRAQMACIALLALFSVEQIWRAHRYTRALIRPIDIYQTIEYRTARWFASNMHGARVMSLGSVEFWLNAFTDTPEMGGGFQNGNINYPSRIATYEIGSGDGAGTRRAEISALWLRAFGVHAIASGGPQTREAFKAFKNGAEFNGLLKQVWHDGDDAIYLIPARDGSLAHVVGPGDLVAHEPVNGMDLAELRKYTAAIDSPALPVSPFTWTSQHSARITAKLTPGQVVATQVNYHKGWHASVNGREQRVFRDGLGLMVIEPQCIGNCSIALSYDGGREMWALRLLSLASLVGGVLWVMGDWYGRRRKT